MDIAGKKGQEGAEARYPKPSAVIHYFAIRNPRLRTPADPTKLLAMPHKTFLALVRCSLLFSSAPSLNVDHTECQSQAHCNPLIWKLILRSTKLAAG